MRFTISAAAAFLAFASSALAQTAGFNPVTSPAKDQELLAGSSFDIIWEPSAAYTGTVTLSLLGGNSPETLTTVAKIQSGVDSSAGKYTWAIDSALGKDATYGIQITLDSDTSVFQYGFPFHIKASGYPGGSTSASGTVTYTISSMTSSSSSNSTYSTVTPPSNYTTKTSGPTGTTLYTTSTAGSTPRPTTTGTSTVPTSGAQVVAAGSLAMFGGLAMAVFAL